VDEVDVGAGLDWEDFLNWTEECLAWPTVVASLSHPACAPSRVTFYQR